MEETVYKRIERLGWKQGLVFDGEQKDALIRNATEKFPWIDETDSLILFTQDCDLLHHSLENEPFVEFLCAQSIETSDINLVYGKNPRRLQVKDSQNTWFQVQMPHRIRISKDVIDENFPVSKKKLTEESLSTLVSWLSKRYSRPAFPDRFNKHLSTIKNLDSKLKRLNQSYPLIKSFYFYLDPFSEISPTEKYSLVIQVLLDGRSLGNECEVNMKTDIEKEVENLFTQPHIAIDGVDCLFEDEMTVFHLSYFKFWDKEYLSRRYGFIQ